MWRWQKACNFFVEKRNLVRRRNEVERAFKGFSWIFPPDLAQRFAHEYQQPPQSQQSPESRATMMPSPKARPPLQCQQSPQSTPTTMVRPRIRPTPLQSQHSVQSPESPPTQRPRLRPTQRPRLRPKLAPPPLAAASEEHVVLREEPKSPQLMALPVAAASEVDVVPREEPESLQLMPTQKLTQQSPQPP